MAGARTTADLMLVDSAAIPMESGVRSRFGVLLAIGLALAAFYAVANPILQVGFLADDYFAGQGVAWHAHEHPGVLDRVVTTFTRRWSEALRFWHRPMLALGAQADYAMFGADGRRHHVTSIALWCLVAAAAGLLARAIGGGRGVAAALAAGVIALFHPAGIEALAWLVARDDLFLGLFGLLALRARVARPGSAVAALPWLVLALFSKETAVVLVPLLTLAGWLVTPPPGSKRASGAALVVRESAPWVLLGAWFAYRRWVLGSLGTSYGPTSYFGDFDLAVLGGNLARSLLQLVAPANATSMADHALPLALVRGAFLAGSGAILACGFVAREPGDLRRALFLLAAIAAPLLLLSPVFVVNAELNGGRGLVLPAATWAALQGLAFGRAWRRPGLRIAVACALATLLAAAAGSLAVALAPYVRATNVAEGAIRSLDSVPPGDSVWIVGLYEPVNGMRPDVIYQSGAYVLSVGLHPAMGPPFRQGPPALVELVKAHDDLLAAPEPRPWAALLPDDSFGVPRFRILARGGSEGPPPVLAPRHGATLAPGAPIVLEVGVPAPARPRVASLEVAVTDLAGHEARLELAGPDLAALARQDGTIAIPATKVSKFLEPDTLRAAGVDVFLWWVEARAADGTAVLRSAWQAIVVPGRP
jgi:hypothetical protein